MNLLSRMRGSRDIETLDDYAALFNQFGFQGIGYGLSSGAGYGVTPSPLTTTLGGQMTEMAPNTYVGLAQGAYASNGVVFACMLVRQLIFSAIRFQWQRLRNGKPSDTFGTPDLQILETPWPGGTTQDMLSRMIQDADLAGNSFWTPQNGEMVRLRPDWVDIVVAPRMMGDGRGQIGWKIFGYVYWERGYGSESDPVGLLPEEVCHFAPIPDPLLSFRGMSWLTPILREIQADMSMTRHQRKFFDNGATPNLVVKHDIGATLAKIKAFSQEMKDEFGGVENAYKTLHLYPGADATVVGANLRQIDFKQVRGGGETRIAAAAGVPPIIVGLSEGLEAATYANYGQARRRLADGTAHPLWQNMAGSVQNVMKVPDRATRLWYDTTDVPFLREDEADAANIANVRSTTINTYITAGFTPDSAVSAVDSGDLGLLKHTGMVSVQLHDPNEKPPEPVNPDADPSKQPVDSEGVPPAKPVKGEPQPGGKKNGATVPANA